MTRTRYYNNLWRHIPRATRHWPEITRGGATNTTIQPTVRPSLFRRWTRDHYCYCNAQPAIIQVSLVLLCSKSAFLVVVVWLAAYNARCFSTHIYGRLYSGWMEAFNVMMKAALSESTKPAIISHRNATNTIGRIVSSCGENLLFRAASVPGIVTL